MCRVSMDAARTHVPRISRSFAYRLTPTLFTRFSARVATAVVSGAAPSCAPASKTGAPADVKITLLPLSTLAVKGCPATSIGRDRMAHTVIRESHTRERSLVSGPAA